MTGITQKVPNYIGGISQQPDELMPLGSVRDAVNVIPDVTNGLSKRPGGRLLNPLSTTTDGTWFHIYRDKNEQYLGHIEKNGTVMMYDILADGIPVEVVYSDKPYEIYPTDDVDDPLNEPVEPDDPTIPSFPSCDWTEVQVGLQDWAETKILVEEKKLEIDILEDEERIPVPPEESEYYYKVEKVDFYKKTYIVHQGKVKGKGPDFRTPDRDDAPDGWDQRLGERRLKNVTVFDGTTFKGRPPGRPGSGNDGYDPNPYVQYDSPTTKADVYPIIWEKPGEPIDNSDEIKEKKDELKVLQEILIVSINNMLKQLLTVLVSSLVKIALKSTQLGLMKILLIVYLVI